MFRSNGVSFYVATNGCDSWSGKLDAPNSDLTDGPFLTLDRARLAVRDILTVDTLDPAVYAKIMRIDILVYVRGGVYNLDKPVVFDELDSALGYRRVVYKAYPNETPVFTSACPIENWTLTTDEVAQCAKGKVYEAPLPKNVGLCTSLYDNHGLLTRSKSELFFPGLENTQLSAQADLPIPPTGNATIDALPEKHKRRYAFRFPEGTLKKWDNLTDVELYLRRFNWTMNLLPLASVDEENRIATVSVGGTYEFSSRAENPSVSIENRVEFITDKGQWAVDTLKKKIYLWPRDEFPTGITTPTLNELIRVEGKGDVDGNNEIGNKEVPVNGVMFSGFTFTCAKRDNWTENDSGMQHDWEMLNKSDALVRFNNVWRCGVENCTFTQSGGTGVRFDNYAINCFAIGCTLSHLGQGGIMLLGYGPGKKDVNSRNTVINCTIHDLGEIYPHSHGIALFQSSENRIAHNYIHHMPRKAICLNGVRLSYYTNPELRKMREFGSTMRMQEIKLPVQRWEDVDQYTHTRDNVIEYNEVEHCLMKMSDGAAINASGCGRNNVIRRNYLHHIFAAPGEVLAGALRTDDDQYDTYLEENVIAHTNCPAYQFKQQNYYTNNVMYDVSPRCMLSYCNRWGVPNRGKFEKNIYVDIYGDSFVFGNVIDQLSDSSTMIIDDNMYYRYTGDNRAKNPEDLVYSDVDYHGTTIAGYDEELYFLRDLGHDTNSTYDVNPELVDPENGDFRLSESSQALKMGIKSVDISKVGPQGIYARKK